MQTTIVYWGYICLRIALRSYWSHAASLRPRSTENDRVVLGIYWIIENRIETTIAYGGNIGIIEMKTTI